MEISPNYEIGDTYSKCKPAVKRKSQFPWKALLLGLVRLAMCVFYLKLGSSQMVVRTDGSTSSKRPFRFKTRGNYRYDELQVMVSVVMMDFPAERHAYVLAGVSSMCLLVAICVNLMRKKSHSQNDKFTDGDKGRGSALAGATAILTIFALNLISMDLVYMIPSALTHTTTIFNNVGQVEALAFLMFFSSLHIFQFFLLFGGLDFQRALLKEGIVSEQSAQINEGIVFEQSAQINEGIVFEQPAQHPRSQELETS